MTRQLLVADTCPACGGVHGMAGDWPTCPEHGHWMYVLRGPLRTAAHQDGTWVYACQAHKCAHTHTQKEKATMTTASEQASAALAIRQDQQQWDGRQLAALAQLGMADAPEGTREVFFHYCQATGLDPFLKQIRLRKDRQRNEAGEWEARWSIETEIEGYRVIAARAAKREGVRWSYGDAQWCNAAGEWVDLWLDDRVPPAGARLRVYKDSAPFEGKVIFREFAKKNKQGQLNAMWATMPAHMIAKCAEAQALKRAFPNDLQHVVLSDDVPAPPQVTVIQEPPPPVTGPKRSGENIEAMRNAIGRHLASRLGITDVHERSAYVHNLANKQVGDDITDADIRAVYAILTEKEDGEYVINDVSGLQALISPEAEEEETP